MRADPGDEADAADGEPQADHQAPVGNAAEARADAAGRALLARTAFARFRRRRTVGRRRRAIARRHAQLRALVILVERRLAARACGFLFCGHT